MNIKQLLEMPHGYRVGGFDLLIKTAKSKKQLPGEKHQKEGTGWIHRVALMDMTGEIWADVAIGKYNPLIAGRSIHIVVCEVQDSDYLNKPCKKLLVSEFTQPVQIGEPPMDFAEGEITKTIRSKILCWLVAARFQSGAATDEILKFVNNPQLKEIVDKIMEG